MPGRFWARRERQRGPGAGLALALVIASLAVGGAPAGAAAAVTAPAQDSVGLFDPTVALWYLRDPAGGTTRLQFGQAGDVPLTGDWDGDGVDSPGVYRADIGWLYLRDGHYQVTESYWLPAGDLLVVADTDGDGRDTVSVAREGRLFVLDSLGTGPSGLEGGDPFPIPLPEGTEVLVGGDFDGDGVDEIAAAHHGQVDLVGRNGQTSLGYIGPALPVAGDWDGDGVETIAGYDAWRAQFRFYQPDGRAVAGTLPYGSTGMLPIAGSFGTLTGDDLPPPYRIGLPRMSQGATGPNVVVLQEQLARLHLYREETTGVFDEATAHAVMAFHKVLGVERTWNWEVEDSARMAGFRLPALPKRADEPDRVEADLGRQVIFVFRDGEVVEIVPVSSGGGYVYYSDFREAYIRATTPLGDYHFYRHVRGWDYVMKTDEDEGPCIHNEDYCVYSPWNFTDWTALHGYEPVPEVPVSHGCIRMTLWDANALEDVLFVGMPIHVWATYEPEGSFSGPVHPYPGQFPQ
jgi:peptidoglycan hydrolase-like protein with peptidoglycan-binding domain